MGGGWPGQVKATVINCTKEAGAGIRGESDLGDVSKSNQPVWGTDLGWGLRERQGCGGRLLYVCPGAGWVVVGHHHRKAALSAGGSQGSDGPGQALWLLSVFIPPMQWCLFKTRFNAHLLYLPLEVIMIFRLPTSQRIKPHPYESDPGNHTGG